MLHWLFELPKVSPVAHAIGLIVLVCAAGMALGSVKFKGIGLGSAGVLFMGILTAQLSQPISAPILNFVKEFGLVLFVFTIGLQLGPGFFASLRAGGARLNLIAAALVLSTGLLTPLIGWLGGLDAEAIPGLFAGVSTNTPALGAVQQALADVPGMTHDRQVLPALACAVSYPVAICALFGTLILLQQIFRIDPAREAEQYLAEQGQAHAPIVRRALRIENPQLSGVSVEVAGRHGGEGLAISRIRAVGSSEVQTAKRDALLHVGDTVLAVGTATVLDAFESFAGKRTGEDLLAAPGRVAFRRVVVTSKILLGKSPGQLGLESLFDVEITRVARGNVETTATPNLRLKFGDVLHIVGTDEQLDKAAAYVGNSLKQLNETQFIPLFFGIFLGVLVGVIPIYLPGLPNAVRLGLAGGPLIIALILGRMGNFGGLVWHMPLTANLAFREFGVALFFAALGLAAGDAFFAAMLSPRGISWLISGLIAATIPLFITGVWMRYVMKMNYVTLGGTLAGAMTNPPALTFVNNQCGSDSAVLAYATVYPLTTLLRIFVAQFLALALCS